MNCPIMEKHSSSTEHPKAALKNRPGPQKAVRIEGAWRETMPRRIRKIREQEGITQTRLQQESGLNPSILSHIELGSRIPSVETLVKISTALSVSPDWLLGLPERKGPADLARGHWKRIIGKRLRFAREHAELNQSLLSRKTGIAAAMISNIENGKRFPSVGSLVSLCEQLKVSSEWLLSLPSFPRGRRVTNHSKKPNRNGEEDPRNH
jgi:transcriptional regulator with XRE-family HTH domain